MVQIFSDEQVMRYGVTRLSGSNVPFGAIRGFHQHDGILRSALEGMLSRPDSPAYAKIEQANGREPLFFGDGLVHIPQYSGFSREYRYRRMIERLIEVSGQSLEYRRLDADGSRRKTSQNYSNFAYDFVAGLFVPEPRERYESRRVFDGVDISDVRDIIIGPPAALLKQSVLIQRGRSEYLDAQLLDVDGRRVLNIGYVHGDQAGRIIEKLLAEYDAVARDRNTSIPVSIYMFGRAGGLLAQQKRHDLVYPVGVINSHDLFSRRSFTYPLDNILEAEPRGLTLNVRSVLDETYEELAAARDRGCICVDMEAWESAMAIERAQARNTLMRPSFNYVCHISDKPLEGDTLADELDSDSGEQAAVAVILDHIRSRRHTSAF